ncbi:MAG: hypothetical protein J1F04_03315 [Oscillospiraceae bacterium]|nr:hypothetical protein [Oscillospiraceae bacterium]
MAYKDGVLSSVEQMQLNYERYKDKFVDKQNDLLNSDTFLKLLVSEMSNQDPLEPTSNTEFISQLASFSQMGYLQDVSKYAMATYASSLVGKTATASRVDGANIITKTGVVESVVKNADGKSYTVTIDGEKFDLSKVTSVTDTPKQEESTGSSGFVSGTDSLGDSISRASMMIGMYAMISGTTPDGKNYIDTGFIESIRVISGKLYVVVNGSSRPIEDIIELTYAYVDDNEGGEAPEGAEGEDVEDVGGVEGDSENTEGN